MTSRDRVERVYREQHDRLWRALYAYSRDRDLAGDAEAEAWSQLLRRGDAVSDPTAWVWTSAFRIANGMLTDRSRTTTLSNRDDVAFSDGSLAEFLDQLARLSEQQRACIVLRYVGGFDSERIGTLLGTTAGTVRVQLHRAHAALRDQMTEGRSHG